MLRVWDIGWSCVRIFVWYHCLGIKDNRISCICSKLDAYKICIDKPPNSLRFSSRDLSIERGKCARIKITFEVRVEPVMLIKFAPASVASALARRVFPVPGGPKSNIPLQGWKKFLQISYKQGREQNQFGYTENACEKQKTWPVTDFHERKALAFSLEE